MLEHTIDRTVGLVPRQRRVVVIGRGHRSFLGTEFQKRAGTVIEQPLALGTLPGILLPASYVWARDPDATLLILPSDHFVHPEERFSRYLCEACWLAEHLVDRLVLLGTTPRRAETEYGWIRPSAFNRGEVAAGVRMSGVEEFHEKPARQEAEKFGRQGFLWNTMIVAVKMRTLRGLVDELFPDWTARFELLSRAYQGLEGVLACDPAAEPSRAYRRARPIDFSGELLEQIAKYTVVLKMDDVLWCDWGRPERIVESLSCIGRTPHFGEKEGASVAAGKGKISGSTHWQKEVEAGAH